MRKYLNFCLLIALLSVFTVVSAQRNGTTPQRTPRTSLIVSADRLSFWLFLDDVLQNEQPVTSIKVEAIPEGEHYLRVEIDNKDHNTVGQFVQLQHYGNAYWIENQRNMYGISPDRGMPRPEAVVYYTSPQQNYQGPQPHGHGHYDNTPQNQPYPTSAAMSDADFKNAMRIINKESFDNSKLSVAKQVLANNLLTIEQIIEICNTFSFENSKLEFAKSAYNHCIEKDKYYLLNSVFSFNSSKEELDKFVREQQR